MRECKCGNKSVVKEHFLSGPKNFKTLENGEKPYGHQMIRTFVHCKACGTLLGTYRHWGNYDKNDI